MAPDSDGDYLIPGTLIDGKFEVRRLLGQGGMGAVVEATHLLRQARVALKFMSPDVLELPGVVERFLNEGVAASRINNEHVVKVLDVSKLPSGQPYLVMEYLDGEDLEALLAREGANGLDDVPRAVHFILQVLRGLQVAHQVGIVHRDLKPANCFVVNYDGDPDFIKIVDFGISKVQPAEGEMSLTHEGSTMGTPLYVSLEQARDASDVDARSDVYSVAVILYELLSGRTPFLPKNMAELFIQLATVEAPSLDTLCDLPPGLADVVQKGLAKGRAERYQSAMDFAVALAPYADSRSEVVLRQLTQRNSGRPSRGSSMAPPTRTKSGTLIAGTGRQTGKPGASPRSAPRSVPQSVLEDTTLAPSAVTPPPPVPPTLAPRQASVQAPLVVPPKASLPLAQRWLLVAVGLLLIGGGILALRSGGEVARTQPATPEAQPQPNPVAPAATLGAIEATTRSLAGERLPELHAEPSPVAVAASGGAIEPPPRAAAPRPPEPPSTPVVRQKAPIPTHRPELKQIGIQD